MPKRRKEVLVGTFIIVSVLLLVLLLYLMGTMDPVLEKSVKLDVEFTDVHGLVAGDPVYLFGYKVGVVNGIELLPREGDEPARVNVNLSLPGRYRSYLRTDSSVLIDKSITGSNMVLIKEGEGQPLPEGESLEGRVAIDFAAVADRMQRVLANAEEIASSVASIMEQVESKADLAMSVSRLAALPEELREDILPVRDQVQELLRVLKGVVDENRIDLRHAVANLKETSGKAKSLTDKLLLTPEKLELTLHDLAQVANEASAVIRDNRQNVDMIMEDLREASTNASNLTAEIKRRPWRILYRPSEEELRAMELYDSAWAYNLGATELNRSLRDLMGFFDGPSKGAAQSEVRPEDLQLAYERVRESLRQQREAEETFWARLRASED